jgi:nucleotidyltransferase substrate binding protein (TIGR01987 family)
MNDQPKFKWSLENLLNAQQTLERFIDLPITNDRDRAGIIQAFEYTFELAWKTLQKYSQENGIQVNGPKMSLKEGLKFRFISLNDEDKWLQMLEDRNLTSHAYKEDVAKAVVNRIIGEHSTTLRSLCNKLRSIS